MTICNMSIEGGARAGLIAPDDTTFEYIARPPPRARRARPGTRPSRAGARSPPTTARAFDKSITIDASALEPMVTYGNNPGMGIPITGRVPRPEDADGPAGPPRASSARSSTWTSSPARRSLGQPVDVVFIGSLHEQPDQRPPPRRRASSRAATSPTASGSWSSRARSR